MDAREIAHRAKHRDILIYLVVKREYYEAFLRGEKTIEYRRHKPPFTEKNFWPGRAIWLTYRYRNGVGFACRCKRFEARQFAELDHALRAQLVDIYGPLNPTDEIALIHVSL